MRAMPIIILATLLSSLQVSAQGAQCFVNGKWYDYASPQCSPQNYEAESGPSQFGASKYREQLEVQRLKLEVDQLMRDQAREQSQETVESLKRSAELQRDTRALRLGITREQLDIWEGHIPAYYGERIVIETDNPETARELGEQRRALEKERECNRLERMKGVRRYTVSAVTASRRLGCPTAFD